MQWSKKVSILSLLVLSVCMISTGVSAKMYHSSVVSKSNVIVQKGIASFYAKKFTGRKMSDGVRFDPNANHAASHNLPLGTVAMVQNVSTGKSSVVKIHDRIGQRGRIIDLSPRTARLIGLTEKQGLTQVVIRTLWIEDTRIKAFSLPKTYHLHKGRRYSFPY